MLILRPFVMQSCKADRQLSIHVPHSQNGLTLIELLPCKLMRLGKKMLIVNHFFFCSLVYITTPLSRAYYVFGVRTVAPRPHA